MEKEIRFLWTILLWTAVIVQIAMSTNVTNETTTTKLPPPPPQAHPQVVEDTSSTGYAWGAWGSWSACSRSCAGGVSYQERQCLPRSLPPASATLPTPIVTVRVRVTRQILGHECRGDERRYRECNMEPCSGSERGMRAEQCAAYDRRPFRGRFYTWVPYIDGDRPCLLNCRPLGQQFYASLALVADGTPCTKPGARAVCVQGVCKVVGRETVLAAGSGVRELRCGRRLVSGLFSRPRLPLGYSYVTTVPRGACRLNVSEIVASENYIALKISNGSYIVNGEFAVSSPGTYDAAGARFLYSRAAGLDQVFALGPILHPIDIMVLYTQPNPSIKYEYFTESLNGEVDIDSPKSDPFDDQSNILTKHSRRHQSFESHGPIAPNIGIVRHPDLNLGVPRHPDLVSMSKEDNSVDTLNENVIGERKFTWKIMSYTQCTRTCGGGLQLGKYRCVETSTTGSDREVSSVHCSGSPPVGKRRRCGNTPCPPRWRAAAWSACPKCGPATRKRIVGCVQDHSRGITKISDQKCPPLKPPTAEPCNIPDCGDLNIGVRRIEPKRARPKEHIDAFRDGPVYTVTVNGSDIDIGPEYSFSVAAGWLLTEWSECVGWCVGDGIQTRGIRCADPSGCAPRKAPDASRTCTPKTLCEAQEGEWFIGDWSPCSSNCGGKQIRGVLCIGGTGRHLRDSACKGRRPPHQRECGTECLASWFFSEWSKCTGNCSSDSTSGLQRRSIVCARADSKSESAVSEADCKATRPQAQRTCELRCHGTSTLPPDLTIESQKAPDYEMTGTTITQKVVARESSLKGCADKLTNCALAVQARLCHYKYYVENCCFSCRG